MSSRRHINKGRFYKLIAPFMRDGLITSKGEKWRQRRRLIGPAFTTTIISQFIPLMVNNASILVKSVGKSSSGVNIVDCIHLTSMDIICQTAMGISPEAQIKPSSLIVQAVTWMTKELAQRIYNPFLWADLIFKESPMGQSFIQHFANFENFTNSIINSKLSNNRLKSDHFPESRSNANEHQPNLEGINNEENINNYINCNGFERNREDHKLNLDKGRKAFLDLLLEKHLQPEAISGKPIIDLNGVHEEINTFLFAGYETTGTAIMWTLYLLGNHN